MPIQPTGSSPTQAQIDMYLMHRDICQNLGIPQFVLHHRGLLGTITTTPAGNRQYTGKGPITSYSGAGEYQTNVNIWMITQTFIRGLERQDDNPMGQIGQSYLQGQCAAIDDNYNYIDIWERDHVIDVNSQWVYLVENPTMDPTGSFWSFILDRQR